MNWTRAENIADRIADLKEALGYRHNPELAKRAGVGKQQVSFWLNGKQRPPKQRLESWAEREGWPIAIFQQGGPMPSSVVNSTVKHLAGHTIGSWAGDDVDAVGGHLGAIKETLEKLLHYANKDGASNRVLHLIVDLRESLEKREVETDLPPFRG